MLKKTGIVVGIMVLNAMMIFVFNKFIEKKVVYARTGIVLIEYEGKQVVDSIFELETQQVQINLQKLQNNYEIIAEKYNNATGATKRNFAYELGVAENEWNSYNEKANADLTRRQQEMLNQVLNEVNNYILEYGKLKRYKMILGSTSAGSLLYGEEAEDITEDLVEFINYRYQLSDAK